MSLNDELRLGGIYKFSDGLDRIVAPLQGPIEPAEQPNYEDMPPGDEDSLIAPQPTTPPLSAGEVEKLFGIERLKEIAKYPPLHMLAHGIRSLSEKSHSPEEAALIQMGANMALAAVIDVAEVQAMNAQLSE